VFFTDFGSGWREFDAGGLESFGFSEIQECTVATPYVEHGADTMRHGKFYNVIELRGFWRVVSVARELLVKLWLTGK
jgi:hypothetical protein